MKHRETTMRRQKKSGSQMAASARSGWVQSYEPRYTARSFREMGMTANGLPIRQYKQPSKPDIKPLSMRTTMGLRASLRCTESGNCAM